MSLKTLHQLILGIVEILNILLWTLKYPSGLPPRDLPRFQSKMFRFLQCPQITDAQLLTSYEDMSNNKKFEMEGHNLWSFKVVL